MNDVIGHLRRAAMHGEGGRLSDSQLLEGFITRRDEASFAALVRRHGPMVLGVCRRVLGNHHDAEDALQATFLVLARKAVSLRSRERVGNWLHGVAYRTALRAKAMTARRRAHEQRAKELARPEVQLDDGWQEMLPLLDQELDRLPERYRVAVVLCDLEGVTRREAARRLSLPEGRLSSQLTRGRKLLARRLARYGLAPAVAAPACVTSTLAASMARAAVRVAGGQSLAVGTVPARVVALTEGVVKTMFLSKLKALVAVTFVMLISAGMVGLSYRPAAAEPGDAPRALADELEALRLEVQSLRKSVDATRERVKALEAEVQTSRERGAAAPKKETATSKQAVPAYYGKVDVKYEQQPATVYEQAVTEYYKSALKAAPKAPDPFAEAESALKALREARDADAQRRAADALEKALQHLKERDVKSPKKE
jgi:RNA polymerase sigma factor (sigma-70 family)